MQAIDNFKYLYLRKNTFYMRVKIPRRIGAREIRLCLRTKNISVAVVVLNRLLPLIKSLKKLVINSRTLDTPSICLRFTQIKDAMLKQLAIADIDPLIAKLEQNYSDSGHTLNALSRDSLLDVDQNFKAQYVYIAQAEDNEKLVVRLQEVVAGLTDEQKWPFLESISTVLKTIYSLEDNGIDSREGLEDQAKQLLHTNGYNIDQNSLPFRVFLSKLTASNTIQTELLSSIFQGDAVGERELKPLIGSVTIAPVVNTHQPQAPESTLPLFSQVYAEFIQHKRVKEKLTDKMLQSYERQYIVWSAIAEDKPIDSYKPQDIGRFIDRCFELPRMNMTPYNNMTWEQRLDVDAPDDDLQSPKSVQQYYKWLMGVFAYAKRDTIAYITVSPCSIKRNFKARTRGIFSDLELKEFLQAADLEKVLWRKWIIYLGIYTGARRSELVQLRTEDIKLDKETKRYYLLITDIHESQKLKTDNAKRKIPLHHDLIKAGFIDYVKTCNERVFSDVKNAEIVTAWMTRQMNSLGIDSTNELEHIRSLHSFRHTFVTKLMNEGVQVNLLQQVVGHEISSLGITGKYTHKATEISKLVNVIDDFSIE
jgi:integrase